LHVEAEPQATAQPEVHVTSHDDVAAAQVV